VFEKIRPIIADEKKRQKRKGKNYQNKKESMGHTGGARGLEDGIDSMLLLYNI